jgi:hypothetical protein
MPLIGHDLSIVLDVTLHWWKVKFHDTETWHLCFLKGSLQARKLYELFSAENMKWWCGSRQTSHASYFITRAEHMNGVVFWYVTLCSLKSSDIFLGMYYLYLQGEMISQVSNQQAASSNQSSVASLSIWSDCPMTTDMPCGEKGRGIDSVDILILASSDSS